MAMTVLQNLVGKITTAIDVAREKGELSPKQYQNLYKAIFFLLTGDPLLRPEIAKFCKKSNTTSALKKLIESIGVSVKLPQALHASVTKNVSLNVARNIWKVSKSDLKLIEKIAVIAGVDTETEQHLLRRYYSSSQLHWLAEVEQELEDVDVIINAQALEDMLLGVFETYKVPKSKTEPFSEVYGLCLGMASRQKITKKGSGTRTKWFVYVDKAVPQIRARVNFDSVTPNLDSIEALVETANSLFPQLEIIGDYHSHPYRNIQKLKDAKGWEASENDATDIVGMYRDLANHPKRRHRMRVTFVIAIAKGRNQRRASSHLPGLPSVFRMSIAGCHVYVSAYRILSNGVMTQKGVTLIRNAGENNFKAS